MAPEIEAAAIRALNRINDKLIDGIVIEAGLPSVFKYVGQKRFLQNVGHHLRQHAYPVEPLPDHLRAMVNRLDQVMQEAA